MLPNAPSWLTKRNGELKPGIRPGVAFVMIAGQPQYRLDIRPAHGQFTCQVIQSVNGKTLGDGKGLYPSSDAAFAGALEIVREHLGWS
jgi:hypothetical protein